MRKFKSYITLLSVIIVGTIAMSIAISLILISVDSTKTTMAYESGKRAEYLARACVETALVKLWDNIDYTGNETVSFTDGSCQILSIENPSTQAPTIKTIGAYHSSTKRFEVKLLQVSTQIQIDYYRQVNGY